MKTGWFFFKLACAAHGPFDSSPVYFNEDELACPGVYFHESPDCHMEIEFSSPSVGAALFTLKIMEALLLIPSQPLLSHPPSLQITAPLVTRTPPSLFYSRR